MSLEEADSSDSNNNNAEMSNERNIIINNEQRSFEVLDAPMPLLFDFVKTEIAEKIHDVLQNKCDKEGNTSFFSECYDVLQNKYDEGNT